MDADLNVINFINKKWHGRKNIYNVVHLKKKNNKN